MGEVNVKLEGSNDQVLNIRVPFSGNLDTGQAGWRQEVLRFIEGALLADAKAQNKS